MKWNEAAQESKQETGEPLAGEADAHRQNGSNGNSGLMIDGVIWKQLLLFSFPLLLGNLFQQLYNTVDSIVVGNFIGGTALAAVGAGSAVINLLIGLFMGITTGAGVVISQFFGAQDEEKLAQAVHTATAFTLLFGLVMTIVGVLLCDPILSWTKTPANVFPQASLYLKIFFCGMLFLMVYNLGAAVLRAVGDSKTPLYYLAIACVANIALDILFVAVMGMDVEGVAIATLIAQALAAFLVIRKLVRCKEIYRLELKRISIHPGRLKRILIIGIPAGIQQMIIGLSNLIVQSFINSFGSDAMAGWSAYGKLDGIMILPVMSFGLAMTTFTGQNVGAKRPDRVRHGVRTCMIMSCTFTILVTTSMVIFCPLIMQIFSQESAVVDYGIQMLRHMVPLYFLLAVIQVLGGTIGGAGHSMATMIIMVGNFCVLRVVWLFAMSQTIESLWLVYLSYIISWITCASCMILYYHKGSWRRELEPVPVNPQTSGK